MIAVDLAVAQTADRNVRIADPWAYFNYHLGASEEGEKHKTTLKRTADAPCLHFADSLIAQKNEREKKKNKKKTADRKM